MDGGGRSKTVMCARQCVPLCSGIDSGQWGMGAMATGGAKVYKSRKTRIGKGRGKGEESSTNVAMGKKSSPLG